MKLQHPSDELIQQYAADENIADIEILSHISACEQCSTSAANYRLLFAAIALEPKPVFDFDAAELVLAKLPGTAANYTKNKIPAYMTLISILVVILPLYFFRKFFINVAGGVSTAVLIIIAATAMAIVLYKTSGMYRKYQKQLDKLNFY